METKANNAGIRRCFGKGLVLSLDKTQAKFQDFKPHLAPSRITCVAQLNTLESF